MGKSSTIWFRVIILFSYFVAELMADTSINFLQHTFNTIQWTEINKVIAQWTRTGYWFPYRDSLKLPYHKSCASDEYRYLWNECNSTYNRTRYHWVSHAFIESKQLPKIYNGNPKLHLKMFKSSNMCEMIKDKTIMFAGDSIQEEFYLSFLSGLNYSSECGPSFQINTFCKTNRDEIGHYNISYVRTDSLSINPTDEYNQNYIERIRMENVSLLFLNTGAHFREDEKLVYEVRSSLSYIKEKFPDTSIIYRNTPAGHGNNFSEEIFSKPLTESIRYDSPEFEEETNPYWHYMDFDRQNKLIEKLIREEFPSVLYIDVYHSTVLRQDSHCDPLHYCIPGPIDNWLKFIYNALQLVHNFAFNDPS